MNHLGGSAGSCHLCQVVILWGYKMLVGGLTKIIHLPSLKSAVGIASATLGELRSERFFASRSGMVLVVVLEYYHDC